MKKAIYAITTTLVVIALFVFVVPISAKSIPHLNFGQLSPGECEKTGRAVVNVMQKVINDVDSGIAGNYWAFDNYFRHIRVWEQSDGSYCAIVRYTGKFDAQEGERSPGDTGDLLGNEDGIMQGGYRAKITGTIKDDPGWPFFGFVGSFNYACDLSGNCPGRVNWVDQYFEAGRNFTYEWWGWIYKALTGTWLNSSDGNAGDVIM